MGQNQSLARQNKPLARVAVGHPTHCVDLMVLIHGQEVSDVVFRESSRTRVDDPGGDRGYLRDRYTHYGIGGECVEFNHDLSLRHASSGLSFSGFCICLLGVCREKPVRQSSVRVRRRGISHNWRWNSSEVTFPCSPRRRKRENDCDRSVYPGCRRLHGLRSRPNISPGANSRSTKSQPLDKTAVIPASEHPSSGNKSLICSHSLSEL